MPHVYLGSKLEMIRSEFRTVTAFSCEKLELRDYTRPERKNFSEVSSRFNTISECFMQRDRQTDRIVTLLPRLCNVSLADAQ